MMLLRLLPLTLSLGFLPALGAQRTEGSSETQKEVEAAEAARAAGEVSSGDGAIRSPAYLTNLVHGTVSLKPRRLAPGEDGIVAVLFILQHPAVVLADAPVSLEYDARQGDLDLGTFQVLPAPTGTLATRFIGSPVHDNSLTVEIPVTVAKTAAHGDVRVTFQAKMPLTDGTTGAPLGEGVIPVHGQVKIGRPLPRPNFVPGAAGSVPAAIGVDPEDDAPTVAPEPKVAPSVARRAALAGGMMVTESAADVDHVVFAVDLPSPTLLPVGGACAGYARIEVPAGQWLFRGAGSALRIEIDGVGSGVAAEIDPVPTADQREVAGKALAVSGGSLSIPIVLRAEATAEVGIRQLTFRLTYQTVGPTGEPTPARTLSVPAVLPVGMVLTTATPWPFYIAGAVLAVMLMLLLARGLRK